MEDDEGKEDGAKASLADASPGAPELAAEMAMGPVFAKLGRRGVAGSEVEASTDGSSRKSGFGGWTKETEEGRYSPGGTEMA